MEVEKDSADIVQAIERKATVVLPHNTEWLKKLDPKLGTDWVVTAAVVFVGVSVSDSNCVVVAAAVDNLMVGKHRKYSNSVRDLLRVIRNKTQHYYDLPEDVQQALGPLPGKQVDKREREL